MTTNESAPVDVGQVLAAIENAADVLHDNHRHRNSPAALKLEAASAAVERLAAERDAARNEIERLRYRVGCGKAFGEQCMDDIESLRQRLTAAEQDAARLALIERERLEVSPIEGGGWDVSVLDSEGGHSTLIATRMDLRAAIDEALENPHD